MRIDKFLWCVRLFKTRSLATGAVRREQVQLNGRMAKASAEVKVSDVLAVREAPIWRSWSILAIPTSRVGARLVAGLITEQTAPADLDWLAHTRLVQARHREPGTGRPTKRERRSWDRLQGE